MAGGTAVTPAGRRYGLIRHPPLVVTPPYTNPPPPYINNKTPAVATDRLLCVPRCVCTAFCVYRFACGPFNDMTPAVATDRLLCVPPCVCTALPVAPLIT